MDPKNLPGTLDPKLKAAYERVMGTAPQTGGSAAQPPATPLSGAPMAPPVTQPVAPPTPNGIRPSVPQVPPVPQIASTPHSGTFVAADVAGKNKRGISPVILIVGAIVFFIVYALFWMRFFNVTPPFFPH